MLTKLSFLNKTNGIYTIAELADPSAGYYIKEVTGLNPTPAELAITKVPNGDGGYFQGFVRGSRNIVVTMALDPRHGGGSAAETRAMLYSALTPGSEIGVGVYSTTLPYMTTVGYVESFETLQFTKSPEVSISIVCPNSDFNDPEKNQVTGLGNDLSDLPIEFEYTGSSPAGFYMNLLSTNGARTPDFVIRHTHASKTTELNFDYQLYTNDIININTRPGGRFVNLIRGGQSSSLLHALMSYGDWPMLRPGTNTIVVRGAGTNAAVEISYNNRYGGV